MSNIKIKKEEETQKGKFQIDDFLKTILTQENKLKIDAYIQKKTFIIWQNFFKEKTEAPLKIEHNEKTQKILVKSETVSQTEQNDSFINNENSYIVRKTSSFENIKITYEHLLSLTKNDKNEEILHSSEGKKNKFYFDFSNEKPNIPNEKSESLSRKFLNFYRENNRKKIKKQKLHKFMLKKLLRNLIFSKIKDQNVVFENSLKFSVKNSNSCFYQKIRVEHFLKKEDQFKTLQNNRSKKIKDAKKKETIHFTKKVQQKHDSFSKIEENVKNSFDNSSNNDSIFLNSEEDEHSFAVSNLENDKKNSFFDRNDDIYEEIKEKFIFLIGYNQKIETFFIGSLLKNMEVFLAIMFFCGKKIYLFVDERTRKQKESLDTAEIDKILMINKGTLENIKTIIKEDIKYFKKFVLKTDHICEIYTRRYLLHLCAIEIFSIHKNYFFICGRDNLEDIFHQFQKLLHVKDKKTHKPNNLLHISLMNGNFFHINFYKLSKSHKFQIYDTHDIIKLALPLWEEGLLSNFDYLMILNIVSGRTYSDLSQYLIFPWVISYVEDLATLDFRDEKNYRNLSKPMGAQIEEKAKNVRDHFMNILMTLDSAPFHYGSHYSNPVVILYYLIRLFPYSEWAKDLQGFYKY